MKFCITCTGPGTDHQGLYQTTGHEVRAFWNFNGELKTFALSPAVIEDCAEFISTHGVGL